MTSHYKNDLTYERNDTAQKRNNFMKSSSQTQKNTITKQKEGRVSTQNETRVSKAESKQVSFHWHSMEKNIMSSTYKCIHIKVCI